MKQTEHTIYKAHGAGNDFVILLGSGAPDAKRMPAAARELCDRHRCIGGDGLVWIDTSAMPRMAQVHVWNPDGSAVGMCLNAVRCVVVLLHRLFAVEQIDIHFTKVAIQAWATPGGARLEFALQASAQHDPAVSAIGPDTWFVDLADPHVVIGWEDGSPISEAPLADMAHANASGGGLCDRPPNCHIVASAEGARQHRIRSFERRVEAETLACGSGCVAAYLALSLDGEHGFHVGSGDRLLLARNGTRWSLEGPALLVFETSMHIAAFADHQAGSVADVA